MSKVKTAPPTARGPARKAPARKAPARKAPARKASGEKSAGASTRLQELEDQIRSLESAQAVIEFTPTGTILRANDLFQAAMGYRLEEIVGKHHSIFLSDAERRTPEYRDFWPQLAQGQARTGQCRRVTKAGQEIWLQASYNPVLDRQGKVERVVKYAVDITPDRQRMADVESQLKSISTYQAVIEFKLDGTIVQANQNFLDCVGYTLPEITGQHHRIFVEPAQHHSHEYQDFWAKLGRGSADSGQYRRLGKGGREIWLQASYCPIFDAEGRPFKVVKYATEITGAKRLEQEMARAVAEAGRVMREVAAGRLGERIEGEFQGDFAVLKTNINDGIDRMSASIRAAGEVARQMSEGNLESEMRGEFAGEFGNLQEAINRSVRDLGLLVGQIRASSSTITSSSTEIAHGNLDLSQRTEQQAASIEETASSMEEITGTVRQNADNAKQANQLASNAREQAERGGAVVTNAIAAMKSINEASNKIADIIGVIDEIAFQTNLLALNAAVEAARAGEQGRGFAVVASEVRNLAQRSAGAAKEIKALIKDSVNRVEEGSRLVNDSGETLSTIVSAVKKVSDIIAEIAEASVEQSIGIDKVNQAITEMDTAVQQNAALVEEVAAASGAMDQQSQSLSQLMERFQITEEAERAARQTLDQSARTPPANSRGLTGAAAGRPPLRTNSGSSPARSAGAASPARTPTRGVGRLAERIGHSAPVREEPAAPALAGAGHWQEF